MNGFNIVGWVLYQSKFGVGSLQIFVSIYTPGLSSNIIELFGGVTFLYLSLICLFRTSRPN